MNQSRWYSNYEHYLYYFYLSNNSIKKMDGILHQSKFYTTVSEKEEFIESWSSYC